MNTVSLANPNRTYTVRGAAVVSRTYAGGDREGFFEITVIRSWRQKSATYQGIVYYRAGAWHAEATRGGSSMEVVGTYADYVDAENALVTIRTRVKSYQSWDGPRPSQPAQAPLCVVCGWALHRDGDCTRTDLHWHLGDLNDNGQYTPAQIEKSRLRVAFLEGKNRSAARTYWADRESVRV